MTFSNDPRQVAQGFANLWPSLVDEPPTPQDYALAMDRLMGGVGRGDPAPNGGLVMGGQIPDHILAAQVLDNHIAAQRNGALAPPGQSALSSADIFAPTSGADGASGNGLGLDAVAAAHPGQVGAVSAMDVAAPAAARGSAAPAPSGMSTAASSAFDPGQAFARPGLSAGPDQLAAAMQRSDPNSAPAGFSVDPQTGAVSRPRVVPSGDPLHPMNLRLDPATPQEKQDYLERSTGARANYAPGVMSPEERQARILQLAGAMPLGSGKDPLARLPVPDAQGTAVLGVLSKGENAPSYDTVYGGGLFDQPPRPVTLMTANETLSYQKKLAAAGETANERPGAKHWKVASPVGKYQFMPSTIQGFIKNGLISGDTVLTPEVQYRLAYRLLLDAGLDKYRGGRMSERQFHANVANTWRSVEAPDSTMTAEGVPAKTTWKQIKSIVGVTGSAVQ